MEEIDSKDEGNTKFSGQALSEELEAMTTDDNKSEQTEATTEIGAAEQAWQNYQGYGEDYQRANAERATTGKIMIDRYPSATLVAQIRVDDDGKAIDGHENIPERQSHRDTEAAFAKYLEETKDNPSQRLVLVEGDLQSVDEMRRAQGLPEGTDPRTLAIESRADTGLATWLAEANNVETVSADPSREQVNQFLEQPGVDRMEIVLRDSILRMANSSSPDSDQTMEVYGQLALSGVEGFQQFTDEDKDRIVSTPGRLEELRSQAAIVITDKLNPLLEQYGLTKFVAGESGGYHIPGMTSEKAWEVAGLNGNKRLAEIFHKTIEFRDRHIFDSVIKTVESGKHPFMVFGGSHIVALEPALNAYFGQEPHKTYGGSQAA